MERREETKIEAAQKIGLIDVDGHNFPNIALMKISAYHKQKGDLVEWWNGLQHYDKVYKAKVFTFTTDIQLCIQANEVVSGGTGYNLTDKLSNEIECIYPDYSLYPQFKDAYGYLTRGCPRQCPFCIVSEKEGTKSIKVADLKQFWTGQKTIKLLDPNLLACPDHLDLIKQLSDSRAWIDFTQGLDARCITQKNSESLSHVKMKMVHFAFDNIADEAYVVKGLEIFKNATKIDYRKTGVYVLTNYNTSHDEDMYRVNIIRDLGYNPYIMIYEKQTAPQITRDLQRWCNNRIIYNATNMNFNNYVNHYLKK